MPTKLATKAFKITGMSMGMMFATMVVGAGLATAGWWYSDRLSLAMGNTLDVNVVGEGNGIPCKPPSEGGPTDPVPGNVSRVIKEDGYTLTQVAMFKCKIGEIYRQRIVNTKNIKEIVPDKGTCIEYSEGKCTRYEKGILTTGYEFAGWKTVSVGDRAKDDWANDPSMNQTVSSASITLTDEVYPKGGLLIDLQNKASMGDTEAMRKAQLIERILENAKARAAALRQQENTRSTIEQNAEQLRLKTGSGR